MPRTARKPISGRAITKATSEASPASLRTIDARTFPYPKELGLTTAYTFSISGRPSKPVGKNINTKTRIPNAATSLYSTEK